MAELWRETKANLNIASEATVLTYTYSGISTREVLARVNLGDASKPIAGGGNYVCRFYVNNVLVSPDVPTPVAVGLTKTILTSRALPIEHNDVVSIRVVGLPADTSINTVASLRDATPLTLSDVLGPGAVQVDHNYGGADNLTYINPGGIGIDNATIKVYLKSDYDGGLGDQAHVIGQTVTDVNGRWVRAFLLDPQTYTIIYYKQGLYGPDRRDIVVV